MKMTTNMPAVPELTLKYDSGRVRSSYHIMDEVDLCIEPNGMMVTGIIISISSDKIRISNSVETDYRLKDIRKIRPSHSEEWDNDSRRKFKRK